MGDKLITIVAITDEEHAKAFMATKTVVEMSERFDLVMASREFELSDFDAVEAAGIDLPNLIRNAMANHVGRRRNRDEMNKKYGAPPDPPEDVD